MAYELKFEYSFNTFQGDEVTVYFLIKDAAAGKTILDPGPQALTLQEYNSDADLFKPTRGFMATFQFVNNNGVRMDDFLHAEDDGVLTEVYVRGSLFWVGYLMQDDFEEPWIDTAHYITLRATDGLGTITGDTDLGTTGQATMYDYFNHFLDGTPIGGTLGSLAWLVCNLFYDGMDDRADDTANTPLNQVTTDVRTFEGETRAKGLEKLLRGWAMTTYQYRGAWWLVRLEEFLNGQTAIRGVRPGLISSPTINKTFLVNIGVDEAIVPVVPFMGRSIRRPSKNTRIEFYYRFPREIICNQTFLRGDIVIPTTDTFEIDCWTLIEAPLSLPVASTADWWRKEEVDGDGNITDNYAFIEGAALETWMKSEFLYLNAGDTVEIGVEFRRQRNTGNGPSSVNIAIIQFISGTDLYTLDDDGVWELATGTWTGNVKHLTMQYSAAENDGDWKQYQLKSKAVPGNGTMSVLLANALGTTGDANFKGLTIEIRESSKQPGVEGDYDQYQLTGNNYKDYIEETYLDDSNNRQHKGALQFSGVLTGDNWYRMDYSAERFTFKRHKAIAHMMLNRRYRMRLNVNMKGLTWDDAGTTRPIWLQNKFVFVDDAPTKIFMIANLEEMNFVDGSWRAELVEIWDSAIDSTDSAEYPDHSFANIYAKDV